MITDAHGEDDARQRHLEMPEQQHDGLEPQRARLGSPSAVRYKPRGLAGWPGQFRRTRRSRRGRAASPSGQRQRGGAVAAYTSELVAVRMAMLAKRASERSLDRSHATC